MTVRTIEIVPLGEVAGAEVRGLDMRAPVPAAVAAEIERALNEHVVLVVRGAPGVAPLSEDEQVAFTAQLGPLEVRSGRPGAAQRPYTRLVSNVTPEGYALMPNELHDTEMFFHHDTCFMPVPQKVLLLHALQVPSRGGNTVFANMYRVYDALPQRLKDRLESLRALHVFIYTKTERADISQGFDKFLHAAHPAVVRHPATGRKLLYVNRLMTMRLEGLAESESDALLQELFAIAERPEFHYEHAWRQGDMVLWDNLVGMHARTAMIPDEARIMRHTSIAGSWVPVP